MTRFYSRKTAFFMSVLRQMLRVEYENEYDLSIPKKLYSEPKIYDAGGDLKKRWYVYFSYRNPKTGRLERQAPVYADLQRYKTLRERRAAARNLREAVASVLSQGYDPFMDEKTGRVRVVTATPVDQVQQMTVDQAFDFVLDLKRPAYGTGFADFKSRVNRFRRWLEKHKFVDRPVSDLNRVLINNYLNEVMIASSPANRNNTRSNLSVLFGVLAENYMVMENFVERIKVEKTTPKKNRPYSAQQQKEIISYLEKNDPLLLLFVKFVCYNFVRPIEVARLRIQDIDVYNKRMYYKAKKKSLKIKIIPDILLQDLPDLSGYDPGAYLFGRNGIGQPWAATESVRSDYYAERFREVKRFLGLGREYGIYSFRHTFTLKIYASLRKQGLTPFEAKSRLMLITGHASMSALEKYLRDIDAELPDDFSDLIG